jgi:hypothetical protein
MVRPVIAITNGFAPVPLRDAEPDAGRGVERWYRRRPAPWYSKLFWSALFVLGIPVMAVLLSGLDYAFAAVFGAAGALVSWALNFLFERLYLDD